MINTNTEQGSLRESGQLFLRGDVPTTRVPTTRTPAEAGPRSENPKPPGECGRASSLGLQAGVSSGLWLWLELRAAPRPGGCAERNWGCRRKTGFASLPLEANAEPAKGALAASPCAAGPRGQRGRTTELGTRCTKTRRSGCPRTGGCNQAEWKYVPVIRQSGARSSFPGFR